MTTSLLQGRSFFCREWAFHKIGQCLETRPTAKTCGALVMGGPGCGKTALSCEIVWPTSCLGKQVMLNKKLLAYYFCQAHDIETLSLANFIQIIIEQISKSGLVEGYTDLLQDPQVQTAISPTACESNPDDAFKRGVLFPLVAIKQPAHNLILLVDSIDESYLQPIQEGVSYSQTIAELLSNHHVLFPPWLLLVCTSRKNSKLITRMFTGFRKIGLDDLRKSQVVRDVQQYILCRLDQEEGLRHHLSRETAEMLNHLHIKSNGCFLYLEKVLDGVADNFILLREIREIPGTLNGLYLWLCQRIFKREHFDKIRLILNVILAARRPLTEMELYSCNFTKNPHLTLDEFHDLVTSMSKVLIEGKDGTKILFHHSFAEWLLDVKHCTLKYLCQAWEGHGMLAMSFTMHAPSLTPIEIQDFALHLAKSKTSSSEDNNVLPLWLLESGADIENSLSQGLPRDQSVLQLLLDAGAKIPQDPVTENNEPSTEMTENMAALPVVKNVGKRSEEEALGAILDSGANVNALDSLGRGMIHNAAQLGNLAAMKLLITRGADVNLTEAGSGQTALNMAAKQGHAQVTKLLLKCGAHVDHLDAEGWTALRSAAWGGHSHVVDLLLKHHAQVDFADSYGRSSLRAAAWSGYDDIVRTLLSHGACVNLADHEGRTALIAAAYMGHADIVERLLDNVADVNHEDVDGRTALSVAALCIPASEGHGAVVSLLLDRGAEVDHKDKEGMTPLLVSSWEGHTRVCELLLESDADPDHADSSGRTPLQAAVSMGHHQVVSLLLFWGSAVDTIDSDGRSVLCLACQQGSVSVVKQLQERGLDELYRDNAGWTPMHFAAFEGHTEVLELLLESGMRVCETDNEGRVPLLLAAQEGHMEAVRLLLEHGTPIATMGHDGKAALRISALEGHRELVDLLIGCGADLNYKDADGRSTLYALALENALGSAAQLLEAGADVESRDQEGRTPLHVAAWQGHREMVALLLRYGADVNATEGEGRSVLQSAAWQGDAGVTRLLLENGACVNAQCRQGATALCIASQEGHSEVVRILLEHKANPNHTDQCGRTASRVALKGGHTAVLRLLEEFGAAPLTGSHSSTTHNTNHSNSGHGVAVRRKTTASKCKTTQSSTVPGLPINETHLSPKSQAKAPSVESGVHLMTSSYESPCSTFDHHHHPLNTKSGCCNSSLSKSSGNATGSNTGSTDQSSSSGVADSLSKEPLTFTQQLQQCSRSKHRPLSKALTPVNEPLLSPSQDRTPSDSPISDIHVSIGSVTSHTEAIKSLSSFRLRSPKLEFSSARGGSTHSSQKSTSTTDEGVHEEPVWQKKPPPIPNREPTRSASGEGCHTAELVGYGKNDMPRCGTYPELPPMAGSGIAMGQRSLSLKSPQARSAIRLGGSSTIGYNVNNSMANPVVSSMGGISMNGYFNQLANLSDLEADESENFDDDDCDLDLVPSFRKALRPTSLPEKKETPL